MVVRFRFDSDGDYRYDTLLRMQVDVESHSRARSDDRW
jgi:hypothetical protein